MCGGTPMNWQSYYDRYECGPGCIGQCPCPEPRWLWNCFRKVQPPKVRDPQKRWTSAMIKKWLGGF